MKNVTKPGLHSFAATCTNCGCGFKYERGDIEMTPAGGKYVTCPECAEWNGHFVSTAPQLESAGPL